jgi:hypothetical protein
VAAAGWAGLAGAAPGDGEGEGDGDGDGEAAGLAAGAGLAGAAVGLGVAAGAQAATSNPASATVAAVPKPRRGRIFEPERFTISSSHYRVVCTPETVSHATSNWPKPPGPYQTGLSYPGRDLGRVKRVENPEPLPDGGGTDSRPAAPRDCGVVADALPCRYHPNCFKALAASL